MMMMRNQLDKWPGKEFKDLMPLTTEQVARIAECEFSGIERPKWACPDCEKHFCMCVPGVPVAYAVASQYVDGPWRAIWEVRILCLCKGVCKSYVRFTYK